MGELGCVPYRLTPRAPLFCDGWTIFVFFKIPKSAFFMSLTVACPTVTCATIHCAGVLRELCQLLFGATYDADLGTLIHSRSPTSTRCFGQAPRMLTHPLGPLLFYQEAVIIRAQSRHRTCNPRPHPPRRQDRQARMRHSKKFHQWGPFRRSLPRE